MLVKASYLKTSLIPQYSITYIDGIMWCGITSPDGTLSSLVLNRLGWDLCQSNLALTYCHLLHARQSSSLPNITFFCSLRLLGLLLLTIRNFPTGPFSYSKSILKILHYTSQTLYRTSHTPILPRATRQLSIRYADIWTRKRNQRNQRKRKLILTRGDF